MRYSAPIVLVVFFGFFLSFSCGGSPSPSGETPTSETSADAGNSDTLVSQPDKGKERSTPPDARPKEQAGPDTTRPDPRSEPPPPDRPGPDAPNPDAPGPDKPTPDTPVPDRTTSDMAAPDVPGPDRPVPDRMVPDRSRPEPPPTEPDAGVMPEPEPVVPEPEPVMPEPEPVTPEPTPERKPPDVPDTPPADRGPPASPLNDEFAGTALGNSWRFLNTNLFKYSVAGGTLFLTPTAYCVWYHRDQGPYIYKSIQGNFTMTTRVRVRKASNTSQPVGSRTAPYQFAGLMLRNPTIQGTNENYIFVVAGMHGPNRGLVIEQKTTVNGRSSVSTTTWASGDAELRLCRVNSAYLLYARVIGATTWTRMRRYTRSDLPSTLQVGMIGYTYTGRFDMRAGFDYIRFQTGITQEADCTK